MSTSPAQRAPTSSLVVPIILGIILVPLSQIGVAYLGGRGASLLSWLVGTPICYFLIGGLGAFATVSGLVPAQARSRGARVGLTAGISGACSSVLILAAIVIWNIVSPPQTASLLHPQAGVTPRLLYFGMTIPASSQFWLVLVLIVFVPIFLGANLLGVGGAPRRAARRIPESPRKPTRCNTDGTNRRARGGEIPEKNSGHCHHCCPPGDLHHGRRPPVLHGYVCGKRRIVGGIPIH